MVAVSRQPVLGVARSLEACLFMLVECFLSDFVAVRLVVLRFLLFFLWLTLAFFFLAAVPPFSLSPYRATTSRVAGRGGCRAFRPRMSPREKQENGATRRKCERSRNTQKCFRFCHTKLVIEMEVLVG